MTTYNRPADFTDALKGFADDEMGQISPAVLVSRGIPAGAFADPHFREVWYVGLWLNVRLKRRGIPMPVIRDLCFRNGQMLGHGMDPWEVTAYRLGEIEAQARLLAKVAETEGRP